MVQKDTAPPARHCRAARGWAARPALRGRRWGVDAWETWAWPAVAVFFHPKWLEKRQNKQKNMDGFGWSFGFRSFYNWDNMEKVDFHHFSGETCGHFWNWDWNKSNGFWLRKQAQNWFWFENIGKPFGKMWLVHMRQLWGTTKTSFDWYRISVRDLLCWSCSFIEKHCSVSNL